MLSNIRNRKEKGFTIIEVLIVLAIAGLILLVVFLAVPALQRNARNTSRTNDVAGILGGMSEYVNNNNGNLPTGITDRATTSFAFEGGTDSNTVEVNLGFYSGSGTAVTITNTVPSAGTVIDEDNVVVVTGAECNDSFTGAVSGSSRSYVALYTLENESRQCKES